MKHTALFRIANVSAFIVVVLIMLLPVAHANQLNLTYDSNGNLITGDGIYRVYNEFNQLVRIYNGSEVSTQDILLKYVYHPTEDRIFAKKVYSPNPIGAASLIEYVIYVNEHYVQAIEDPITITKTNETYYVSDETGMVGEITIIDNGSVGKKLYRHNDHLGSTSVLTNESGDLVQETFYGPYGSIISGGTESRFSYEGKEYSTVTQDYDFHFRKYNPDLGIFTQPDSLIQNVYDPQTLNRYTFERNNPYKYTDPSGHVLPLLIIGAVLVSSAVLGFAMSATTSYYYQKKTQESVDMSRVWKSGAIGAGLSVGVTGLILATGGLGAAIGTSAGSVASTLGVEIVLDVASGIGLEYLEDFENKNDELLIEKEIRDEENKIIGTYLDVNQGTIVPEQYVPSSTVTVNIYLENLRRSRSSRGSSSRSGYWSWWYSGGGNDGPVGDSTCGPNPNPVLSPHC